jgi:hypothetical protein
MSRIKFDLIGKTINFLSVLKKSEKKDSNNTTYFDCRCICGKVTPIRGDILSHKKVKSCGCLRNKDLVGVKFNKLTVIGDSGERCASGREKYWNCKCECGQICKVRTSIVTSGKRLSCGCIIKSNGKEHPSWKGNGDISGSFYVNLKNNAARRGIDFNVPIEYLWDTFQKQKGRCNLSGVELCFPHNQRQKRFRTASLDRIDSSKGYVIGNVQWVHKNINFMKLNLSDEDFIGWCKLVVNKSVDKLRVSV